MHLSIRKTAKRPKWMRDPLHKEWVEYKQKLEQKQKPDAPGMQLLANPTAEVETVPSSFEQAYQEEVGRGIDVLDPKQLILEDLPDIGEGKVKSLKKTLPPMSGRKVGPGAPVTEEDIETPAPSHIHPRKRPLTQIGSRSFVDFLKIAAIEQSFQGTIETDPVARQQQIQSTMPGTSVQNAVSKQMRGKDYKDLSQSEKQEVDKKIKEQAGVK